MEELEEKVVLIHSPTQSKRNHMQQPVKNMLHESAHNSKYAWQRERTILIIQNNIFNGDEVQNHIVALYRKCQSLDPTADYLCVLSKVED